MTNEQKQQVKDALMRYICEAATQNQVVPLKGINDAVIAQVKNNNWELISEHTWYSIARQVGFYCGEWQCADTSAYMLLRILFSDAQHYAMSYGIAMANGLGKSFSARQYAREVGNTYYMPCTDTLNRKTFLVALAHAADRQLKGTVPDMMHDFVAFIREQDEPLIVIDDAHKLKDRVLHFLILLTNSLAGNCGIVIMGNDELRMRIIEGVRMNKEGYELIYKSIGRRFITLGQLGPKDITLICEANSVTDEATIAFIEKECSGTLQHIEHLVEEARMKTAA